MPFKRPGPQPHEAASSSSRSATPSRPPPRKRARLSSHRKKHILKDITLHILDAKLQPEMVAELYALAESGGAKVVGNVDEAEVVVTAIGMRKRLERHVSWNIAVSGMGTPCLNLPGRAIPYSTSLYTNDLHALDLRLLFGFWERCRTLLIKTLQRTDRNPNHLSHQLGCVTPYTKVLPNPAVTTPPSPTFNRAPRPTAPPMTLTLALALTPTPTLLP